MRRRIFALAIAAGMCLAASQSALGQPGARPAGKGAPKWKMPRTADGRPELQGIWTMATYTPFERPDHLAGKEFFTEDEAAALVKELTADGVNPVGTVSPLSEADPEKRRERLRQRDDDIHYDNEIWATERTRRSLSTLRTSLVVDPKDGRIPPLTAEAKQRDDERFRTATHLWDITPYLKDDSYETRSFHERCLVWRHEGPPLLPSSYLDRIEIFQTRDFIAIHHELSNNQARIIPLDGRAHLGASLRQWAGDSRGRWEGDTLVVETTNYTDKTHFRGSSDRLRVVERLTRLDADTIRYQFTVEDAWAWTRPWSAEIPMKVADGPLFEYACHEGNYALPNLLGAARKQESGGR